MNRAVHSGEKPRSAVRSRLTVQRGLATGASHAPRLRCRWTGQGFRSVGSLKRLPVRGQRVQRLYVGRAHGLRPKPQVPGVAESVRFQIDARHPESLAHGLTNAREGLSFTPSNQLNLPNLSSAVGRQLSRGSQSGTSAVGVHGRTIESQPLSRLAWERASGIFHQRLLIPRQTPAAGEAF